MVTFRAFEGDGELVAVGLVGDDKGRGVLLCTAGGEQQDSERDTEDSGQDSFHDRSPIKSQVVIN